jgi:hypothetical protein
MNDLEIFLWVSYVMRSTRTSFSPDLVKFVNRKE